MGNVQCYRLKMSSHTITPDGDGDNSVKHMYTAKINDYITLLIDSKHANFKKKTP